MKQKRLLFLLALLMTAATGAWAAEVTVTKTVNDLFPEVANGTQKATLYSDANLSISVNPDGNNGKVYATGTEWRLYQTNSAVVTVAATEATIKSVAFEFTVKNTGVIKYDGNAMTSGTAVNVNAASAQFVVGNFYDATNGQVIISGFTVVYETTGGASGYTVSLNDGTENPTTWTASTDGTNFGALPIGGLKGDGSETVTLKYNGRLKVKSVTATSDAGAPAAAMPMLTLGSMPNGGDPFSGSSGSGAYSQTFAVGGQIAIIYKNTSNESVKVVTDALTAADISNEGKTATINVSIDDADKTQGVTYIYPAAMANDEGTINYDFKNQDGTVTAIYSGSGAWDGDALSSATMESQQAIVKFTLQDKGGNTINASSLNISAASNKLVKYKSYRGAGTKTYYYGDSYYTVDGGSGGFNEDEEHKSLVDNKLDTKWCQNKPGGNWYIEFHTASAIQVDGYMLRTGGDTGSETGRNPQSWVLYGKKNSGESWSIIDSKTDNYDMPNASNAEKDFDADAPGQYQYFRLEISAIRGGSCMQMSEMRLFSYEYYELGTTYGDLTVTPASATSEMTVALRNENTSDDTYTLTATVGGATYNYTKSGVTFENGKYYVITVKMNPKKVSSISLNKTSANLAIGGTVELSVSNVSPSDAVDKTVTWSSDKTSVATVNATTGVVTAVAEGTATITATANDGSGTKATCSVTVYPEGTIVWNSSNISDLRVMGSYASYTKEGITLSGNTDMVEARWYDFGNPEMDGIGFEIYGTGGFTFTAPTGKAFTKIEMKAQGPAGWDMANLGDGWACNWDPDTNKATVTWTGSAASTVGLLTGADMFSGERVKSIVFYLSE